jgi:hypothetical protein
MSRMGAKQSRPEVAESRRSGFGRAVCQCGRSEGSFPRRDTSCAGSSASPNMPFKQTVSQGVVGHKLFECHSLTSRPFHLVRGRSRAVSSARGFLPPKELSTSVSNREARCSRRQISAMLPSPRRHSSTMHTLPLPNTACGWLAGWPLQPARLALSPARNQCRRSVLRALITDTRARNEGYCSPVNGRFGRKRYGAAHENHAWCRSTPVIES